MQYRLPSSDPRGNCRFAHSPLPMPVIQARHPGMPPLHAAHHATGASENAPASV